MSSLRPGPCNNWDDLEDFRRDGWTGESLGWMPESREMYVSGKKNLVNPLMTKKKKKK